MKQNWQPWSQQLYQPEDTIETGLSTWGEQYNPEAARQNTPKSKYSISIEKTKYFMKQNWQPWSQQLYQPEDTIETGLSTWGSAGQNKACNEKCVHNCWQVT